MRHRFFIAGITCLLLLTAQAATAQLYNPEEDAEYEISKTLKLAKNANRNVFIQIGGNWCGPCLRFYNFMTSDKEMNDLLNSNFVVYHLNYSKENMNEKLMQKYGYPQQMNFPVFLILDSEGKLLHTQKVAHLVKGNDYDRDKVINFLNNWKPAKAVPEGIANNNGQ